MRFYIILSLLLYVPALLAQPNYQKRANDFFKVHNYEKALPDYQRALKKKSGNIEILERILACFDHANFNRHEALEYVKLLEQVKPFHPQLPLYFANTYFHGHQFDKSIEYLNIYLKNSALKEFDLQTIKLLQQNILNAQALIANPINVTFINMGDQINTDRSELNPLINANETVLFYASDKRYLSDVGMNYYNICLSLNTDGNWIQAKTIGSKINSIFDEIPTGLNSDGTKLILYHNRFGAEQISWANYSGEYKFGDLNDFGPIINKLGSQYGACLTATEDTLYFASEPDNGNTNIYYSIKLPDGNWGDPRLIPGKINSEADENFPMLSNHGQRLYFCSNGEQSMGGYDLFYSDYDTIKNEWGMPVNLGYPINDTYDNYTISMVEDKRYGYVSAIREDTHGLRDIYRVVFNNQESIPHVIKGEVKIKQLETNTEKKFNLSIYIKQTTTDELVGKYNCSGSTNSFILILNPGQYALELKNKGETIYFETLNIPDQNISTENKIIEVTLK